MTPLRDALAAYDRMLDDPYADSETDESVALLDAVLAAARDAVDAEQDA